MSPGRDEGPRVPATLLQIRAGGAPDAGCCYKEARAAGVASRASHASAMLNAQERAQVAQVWDLIAGHEAPFGAELLLRLFTVYPSTKIYFKHLGACPDEVNLLSHGKRMLEAVGVAVQHMDNLRWALSPLADLHAHVLRVDPANFPLLIQCFQVVLASHLQDEFTVEMQAAWDKFLTGVAVVLTEKYR